MSSPINYVATRLSNNLAEMIANQFLMTLRLMHNTKPSNDPSIDLSRGDYKTSVAFLEKEVAEAGLRIDAAYRFGPKQDIGSLTVYVLKPAA